MTTPATPISRRARPAKAPLTREVIIQTGLTVLDRDGMDALTMRKVAQELDTGAASLYVYVKNRDDLLAAMLDEALADVVPKVASGPWRKRLTSLIEASIEAMARHQGLALVALGGVPNGLNALLILDSTLALLKEAGLDNATAAWAVDLLHLHITAAAAEHSAHNDMAASGQTEAGHLQHAHDHFASLPADRYPMIVAMREQLLSGSGDHRARWSLDVLLNGILSTPASAELGI
jgi:AcrR family transcriptional regulator